MKPSAYIVLGLFAVFAWYELFRPAQTVAIVPNNPSTPNALGVPTAPINASSLTPAQLGTGLFEDPSGLGSQQPGTTFADTLSSINVSHAP